MYPVATDRLHEAWYRRTATDYRFDFWTALGWSLLSCGVYSYYVTYQLARRMREHNLRRLAFLDAANELAWQRAVAAGRAEELTPAFHRTAAHLDVLRRLSGEFRDPAIWLVIILFSGGIGMLVLHVLLDQDLVKHAAAEAAAEAELAALAGTLGAHPMPALPVAHLKGQHNYAGRIIATFATCGIYAYVWLYDLMDEGNRHFDRDAAWEDAFVAATAGPASLAR